MTLTGKQKAAMLLMSLDAATAAQMLKGLNEKVVRELAVELAYLDATGLKSDRQSVEVAMQFCSSLFAKEEFRIDKFLGELLKSAVGEVNARNIQTEISNMLHKRDPFIPIRSADSQTLATVLDGEHPQAAAVVLSELPARKSSEVLSLLEDNIRSSAVGRMALSESVSAETKARIAETVCGRIEASTKGTDGAVAAQPQQVLRKVAVILRNLSKEIRDGLLDAIKQKDSTAGETVTNLMIIWADIPLVADRSLQEGLRGIDSIKLALALHEADEAIINKIRSNLSERASASIDEEASLMSAPKKEEVEEAREEIVQILRQINEKGELSFVEE